MINRENEYWRNREWLEIEYHDKDRSWADIAKQIGLSSARIRQIAKSFGIKSKSISEIRGRINDLPMDDIAEQYNSGYSILSLAAKHGVVYSVMYNKLLKHGVKPRNRQETRSITLNSRDGSVPLDEWANKEWLADKYKNNSINFIASLVGWSYTYVHDLMVDLGIEIRNNSDALKHKWGDSEYRNKHAEYLARNPKISNVQIKLYDILDGLNIEYIPESEGTRVGYYCFDAFIPKNALLIEVQGEYWHSRDSAINRDRKKYDYIRKYFPEYNILYLWEDMINNDQEQVINIIKQRIANSLPLKDFEFSDVSISEASFNDVKHFLDAYHYLGGSRPGRSIIAMLGDEIIASIVFSPPLRQQLNLYYDSDDLVEISRLCVAPDRHKKNFMSWFLSRSIKLIDHELIISYSDDSYGHSGAVYLAANFKLDHVIPPDYWYVDSDGYVMHKKTLYNKAIKNGMKESEYCNMFGYRKKHGLKKNAFVFRCKSR